MAEEFKRKLIPFSCFKNTTILDNNNKGKRKNFLKILREKEDYIYNSYADQNDFCEILPSIKRNYRRNNYYKKMVNKGHKFKSPFFKLLIKTIKDIEDKNMKKNFVHTKRKNMFLKPELELLKLRKEKMERMSENKARKIEFKDENIRNYKNKIREQISLIISTPKSLSPLSGSNLNSTDNSINKNWNSTDKLDLSSTVKDLSTFYKSKPQMQKLERNRTLNAISPGKMRTTYIYNKCRELINNGKYVNSFLNKKEQFSKRIKTLLRKATINNSTEKYIIEKKNKYSKLEENNIKEIKKRLDEIMSDKLAYQNRKEIKEILKNTVKTNAYNLYSKELTKFLEKMEKHNDYERKRIDMAQDLCQKQFDKKQYLYNLIDMLRQKHEELILTEGFYIINNNKVSSNMGTLFPKLLTLRPKCLKEIRVGNFIKQKKNK